MDFNSSFWILFKWLEVVTFSPVDCNQCFTIFFLLNTKPCFRELFLTDGSKTPETQKRLGWAHMSSPCHVTVTWHEGCLFNAHVLLFFSCVTCMQLSSLSPSFPLLTYAGFWQLSSSVPKVEFLQGFKNSSWNTCNSMPLGRVEAPIHLLVTAESLIEINWAAFS